ncbi:MAG: PDDEXK nuclease domain-containing protein [Planctomycetaceae bacterium]|jgi:predicted nuclease of restriction endonuclease-like (RecB) superfamily|nr:PDDEXK nuclease domain-containing protein [Planctomycetaceae bacterium]
MKKVKKTKIAVIDNKSYIKVVSEIKKHIKSAQYKAVLAANQELIRLYWNIGTVINRHAVWGNKFLENLAADIKAEFPDLTGYSVRNLAYMSKFAALFPQSEILQVPLAELGGKVEKTVSAQSKNQILQVPLAELGGKVGKTASAQSKNLILQVPLAELGGKVGKPASAQSKNQILQVPLAELEGKIGQTVSTQSEGQKVQASLTQITWYHHIALMDKVKDIEVYRWYAGQTAENGWSRNILVHQIETRLYERQKKAKKTTNFHSRLPSPQSELALQTLKDPYIFDFITFRKGMVERDIENELVNNITKMLLELGEGFAFIGKQYHLEVGGEDFYIDMLFYNLKLRCYIVIELKTGNFKPEYVGKMNFYLSAVDNIMKTDLDQPTIGLLLCKNKNRVIAEYALRNIDKPIGVSEYQLTKKLPRKLEKLLPSVTEIERQLSKSDQ